MSEVRQIISQIVEDSQHRSRSGHKMDPNSIQLLLCGDLNSLPDSGNFTFASVMRLYSLIRFEVCFIQVSTFFVLCDTFFVLCDFFHFFFYDNILFFRRS